MPSLHSSTKSRAANSQYSLVLHAQHRLQYGQPLNEPVVRVKSALPAEVDVFLDSNLVITLGATVDHKKIPEDVLEVSGFVRHLKDILADNASGLALSHVSNTFLNEDNMLSVVLTPQVFKKPLACSPYLLLQGIHLQYSWKCNSADHQTESQSEPNDITSTRLCLPLQALVGEVHGRFLSYHMARRYPLIFGPWAMQHELERAMTSKLFRSIKNIIARSADEDFRQRCRRLFKTLRKLDSSHSDDARHDIAALLGADNRYTDEDSCSKPSDGQAMERSLDVIYQRGLRRPLLKTGGMKDVNVADDENLALNFANPGLALSAPLEHPLSGSPSFVPSNDVPCLASNLDARIFRDEHFPEMNYNVFSHPSSDLPFADDYNDSAALGDSDLCVEEDGQDTFDMDPSGREAKVSALELSVEDEMTFPADESVLWKDPTSDQDSLFGIESSFEDDVNDLTIDDILHNQRRLSASDSAFNVLPTSNSPDISRQELHLLHDDMEQMLCYFSASSSSDELFHSDTEVVEHNAEVLSLFGHEDRTMGGSEGETGSYAEGIDWGFVSSDDGEQAKMQGVHDEEYGDAGLFSNVDDIEGDLFLEDF